MSEKVIKFSISTRNPVSNTHHLFATIYNFWAKYIYFCVLVNCQLSLHCVQGSMLPLRNFLGLSLILLCFGDDGPLVVQAHQRGRIQRFRGREDQFSAKMKSLLAMEGSGVASNPKILKLLREFMENPLPPIMNPSRLGSADLTKRVRGGSSESGETTTGSPPIDYKEVICGSGSPQVNPALCDTAVQNICDLTSTFCSNVQRSQPIPALTREDDGRRSEEDPDSIKIIACDLLTKYCADLDQNHPCHPDGSQCTDCNCQGPCPGAKRGYCASAPNCTSGATPVCPTFFCDGNGAIQPNCRDPTQSLQCEDATGTVKCGDDHSGLPFCPGGPSPSCTFDTSVVNCPTPNGQTTCSADSGTPFCDSDAPKCPDSQDSLQPQDVLCHDSSAYIFCNSDTFSCPIPGTLYTCKNGGQLVCSSDVADGPGVVNCTDNTIPECIRPVPYCLSDCGGSYPYCPDNLTPICRLANESPVCGYNIPYVYCPHGYGECDEVPTCDVATGIISCPTPDKGATCFDGGPPACDQNGVISCSDGSTSRCRYVPNCASGSPVCSAYPLTPDPICGLGNAVPRCNGEKAICPPDGGGSTSNAYCGVSPQCSGGFVCCSDGYQCAATKSNGSEPWCSNGGQFQCVLRYNDFGYPIPTPTCGKNSDFPDQTGNVHCRLVLDDQQPLCYANSIKCPDQSEPFCYGNPSASVGCHVGEPSCANGQPACPGYLEASCKSGGVASCQSPEGSKGSCGCKP